VNRAGGRHCNPRTSHADAPRAVRRPRCGAYCGVRLHRGVLPPRATAQRFGLSLTGGLCQSAGV